MMVTRAARQLLALGKRKRKDSLFNPSLQELKDTSENLDLAKAKGIQKQMYRETGLQSAADVLRKKVGMKL
jgi:hypothetical protein|tara:strand:- start:20 stop:232 length:213 start_codon:yes stop_codon:yes gene_type:complete